MHRSNGDIKNDISRCTACFYERSSCSKECGKCNNLPYEENYSKLEIENYNALKDADKRKSIIYDVPTEELEAMCNAWRENRIDAATLE